MWPFGQNNPKHDDLTSDTHTHTYELLVSAEIISKTKTNENNK